MKGIRWFFAIITLTALLIGTPVLLVGQPDDFNGPSTPTPPAQPTPPTPPKPVIVAPKQPPVEIMVTADRAKFVGEQNIVLRAAVVFYQQINPFWEELLKKDFSPFAVGKVIIGERKIFDRDKDLARDYREVTFLLSLPASAKCGTYSIPSFSLGYSYFTGEKREIRATAKSKAIKVEKVPILVTYEMDKDVINIGDVNNIRLTIWRENYIRVLNYELKRQLNDASNLEKEGFERWLKSLEVRGQKITDLNKPDFANFKVLAKSSAAEIQGLITKEVFEYRFSFYELGGKEFKIPGFHIWYLDESQEGHAKQPKEITTPSFAVQVNLVVKPDRRSIEGLKSTEPTSKYNLYYFGYAPLALGGVCFLIFAGSILVSCFRPRQKSAGAKEESLTDVRKKLLAFREPEIISSGTIIKIRNEFFKLLGIIVGLSKNQALAQTTSEMLNLFKKAGFSEDVIRDLEACMKFLDKSISLFESEKSFSEAWKQIDGILSQSEISRRFKGKKRFLFF
ncbi:MAG: hypothetical protein Q8N42_00165 [bacterium]|nr:hypothetical protein [bacterium]